MTIILASNMKYVDGAKTWGQTALSTRRRADSWLREDWWPPWDRVVSPHVFGLCIVAEPAGTRIWRIASEVTMRDFRYGLRGLRQQPGFALLAIVALALGIGATTTIFSVIENVLLDPFPYADAGRIVSIVIHDQAGRPGGRSWFEVPEFLDYQNQNHVFEEVIGGGNQDVLYTSGPGTERFDGSYVTANMFQFLGVPALIGRTILPEDAKPGAAPVFVMDYRLWQNRFNGDQNILGRSFVLNGSPMTLVGGMPPRFPKRGAG